MKRILTIFVIILVARITAFSSTILVETNPDSIPVSVNDLKYANLIFAEHSKLVQENSLLYKQLDNYRIINSNLEQVDSLRLKQIEDLNYKYSLKVDNLNKEIKDKNKIIRGLQIGSITVGIGLVLALLIK